MPRKMRVEYPGAMYHVMSRGDQRMKGVSLYFDPSISRLDTVHRWTFHLEKREAYLHPRSAEYARRAKQIPIS